jgi:hypothetical protein
LASFYNAKTSDLETTFLNILICKPCKLIKLTVHGYLVLIDLSTISDSPQPECPCICDTFGTNFAGTSGKPDNQKEYK